MAKAPAGRKIHKTSFEMTNDEVVEMLDEVAFNFKGQVTTLDRALGMYFFARTVGWKPTYLMRDKRKIKQAEEILGISFREHFRETEKKPEKSVAWVLAQKVSSFWRAVRGDYPDIRSSEVAEV